MKKGFWTADWFAGLIITLVVLIGWRQGIIDSWFERPAYDLGVRMAIAEPSDQIAIIAIDEQSIANIGRWPWSREVHANMIEILEQGGAKVIGSQVMFLEEQIDPGLESLSYLADYFASTSLYESGIAEIDILGMAVEEVAAASEGQDSEELQEAVLMLQEFLAESSLMSTVSDEVDEFVNLFVEELQALDTDGLLAASMESAGNVVLGMPFFPGAVLGNPDSELPVYITVNSISEDNVNDRIGAEIEGLYPWPANQLIPPIERLGALSSGIGHVTQILDVDGGIRYEPLIMSYYDQYYPSIALVLAAKTLNLGIEDIKIYLGEGVQLGRLNISTDEYLRMNTFFYTGEDDRPPFSIDSFFDVYEGKIPADKYSGKLVLIGTTAIGIGVLQKTPVAGKMESLLTLAHTVSSIL